jgi:small subunit ribosomal protein S6
LRTYETVFVLKPDLTAEAQNEQIEFYKDNIVKNGGEILKVDPWGKIPMAYKIDNYGEGVYVLIQFNAETDYVEELEKRYKFNESVMRHIIVMIDGKKFKLNPKKEPKRDRRPRRQDEEAGMDADADEDSGDEFQDDVATETETEAAEEEQA